MLKRQRGELEVKGEGRIFLLLSYILGQDVTKAGTILPMAKRATVP